MFHSHQDEIEGAEQRESEVREDKAWDFLIAYQPQDAVRAIKGEIRPQEEIASKDEIDFLMEDHFFHLELPPPPPEVFGFNPYDEDLPLGVMPPALDLMDGEGWDWDSGADFDPQDLLMRHMPYE